MLKSINNINLYSDFTSKNYIGVILFNLKGRKCEEITRILNKNQIFIRDGYHCSPLAHKKLGTIEKGGIRLSFGYYNTIQELDKFYNVIKKLT
jgi:selenocysteine lyase/cysteine desulfurase